MSYSGTIMVTPGPIDELLRNLLAEASVLQAVPEPDVAAYVNSKDTIAEFVDDRLATDAVRVGLRMRAPVELLRSNHRNHVEFMAAVYEFSAWPVLVRSVVWVYRSYVARGVPTDYFPLEIDAFRDAIRTLLPESAGSLDPVYAFLRRSHPTFVQLSKAGDEDVRLPRSEPEERFVRALLRADGAEAIAVARQCVTERSHVEAFFTGVVAPAMMEVGAQWESGRISVAHEHVATAIANRAMASLYEKYVLTTPGKGRAVVVCATGELHEMGARMVADLLEMDGWDVHFAGSDVPISSLASLLEPAPFLVALSASMFAHLPRVREAIAVIRTTSGTAGTQVLAGGRALAGALELGDALRADAVALGAADAVRIASGWWNARGGAD